MRLLIGFMASAVMLTMVPSIGDAQTMYYNYWNGRRWVYTTQPMRYYVVQSSGQGNEAGEPTPGRIGGGSQQGTGSGTDTSSSAGTSTSSLRSQLRAKLLERVLDQVIDGGTAPNMEIVTMFLSTLSEKAETQSGDSLFAELLMRQMVGRSAPAAAAAMPAPSNSGDPELRAAETTAQVYTAWKADIDARAKADQMFADKINELKAMQTKLAKDRTDALTTVNQQVSTLKASLPAAQQALVP